MGGEPYGWHTLGQPLTFFSINLHFWQNHISAAVAFGVPQDCTFA